MLEDYLQKESTAILLTIPYEVREKIYSYLRQSDFLLLRQVCEDLRYECDNFTTYNIVFRYQSESGNDVQQPVPFPHLNSLQINNDREELPWGDCEGDSVKSLILESLTYTTFRSLGKIQSVEDVLLRSGTFNRTIPQLNWNLKKLHIEFLVTPEQRESYMLDNLDSLLIQNFGNLEELSLVACNQAYQNIQRQYALRTLRFLAKHSKKLKTVKLMMECLPCVSRHYVYNPERTTSALNDQEISSLKEIQVESLALYLAEVICPLCYHWQNLIRQQKNLKSLQLCIYSASRLPTIFFCPRNNSSFQFLQDLTIRLWGLDGYFPFDCRFLSEAVNLRSLEICRYAPQRFQVSDGEILNTHFLPEGLTHVYFVGLLLSSQIIPDLFLQLSNMKRLVCIECGAGVDTGFNITHIPLIHQHENITDLMIDFSSPGVDNYEQAVNNIKNALNTINVESKHFKNLPGVPSFGNKHRFWIGKFEKDENSRAEATETVAFLTGYDFETKNAIRGVLNE